MNIKSGRLLLLILGLAFTLVACANDGGEPTTAEQNVEVVEEASETATPEPSATPTDEPTETPTVTPEPTPTVEASVTSQPAATAEPLSLTPPAVQTMEAILAPPQFVLDELESYTAESSGLTFDFPAGWIITDNQEVGIRIESEAGIGDQMPNANGASVTIITVPADEFAGETLVEKLAAFILGNGMPPSTILGQPSGATVNGQELAFTSFVDSTEGLEGVFAVYSAGDELALIFALAAGESRVSYRPAVEAIVSSLILPQSEQP